MILQALYKKLKAAQKRRKQQDAALYGKMFKALGKGSSHDKTSAAENGHADQHTNGDVQAAEGKDQGTEEAAAAAEEGVAGMDLAAAAAAAAETNGGAPMVVDTAA